MAIHHGVIGAFDSGVEQWQTYSERLEQYFLANDVEAPEKQRAILLSVCGPATYQLIRNLAAPQKPSEVSFAGVVKLVQDHFNPTPSVIVQRFKFHSRSQKEGESTAQFVAELRRLSEYCKFETVLDDMLRDRLVCGIRDARVQRRLLAETSLDFKKAFELAQAAEIAEQNARDIQKLPSAEPQPLHDIGKVSLPARSCYRCGGAHSADKCRFKDSECHHCHKKGHIAKVCRSKAKQQLPSDQAKPRSRNTLQVTEEQTEDTAEAAYGMFALQDPKQSSKVAQQFIASYSQH